MFGFEKYGRKKVVIDRTQNEETAKNYGYNLIPGNTVCVMVVGKVMHTKDAYYLIDTKKRESAEVFLLDMRMIPVRNI